MKNNTKKKKKPKNKHKKKQGKEKSTEFRKKAPRRKVTVEVQITPSAFKGHGSNFKLFDSSN